MNRYSRDRYAARSRDDASERRPVRDDSRPRSQRQEPQRSGMPRQTPVRSSRPRVTRPDTSHRAPASNTRSRNTSATRRARQDAPYLQVPARHHDAYVSGMASYSLSSGNAAAFQKHGSKRILVIIALVLAAIAVAVWLVFFPPMYDVSVNGKTVSVAANSTLQKLVDDGHATPAAGDLLAVDGSVAKQGEGDLLSATIDGEATNDPQARVAKGAAVVIEDGADVTEEYEETTARLPYGASTMTATPDSYYKGSVHLYSTGVDGVQSVRTGKVSGKTVTSVIEQPVNSGFTAYSPDTDGEKVIALTFDDGPWPESSRQILDILNENDAHATFFVIGNQCKDNATVLKQIAEAGNQVATHSYDHADGSGQGVNMTLMSTDEQIAEVTKGFDAIEDVLGYQVSHVMRAPGGNYYGPMVETLASHVTAELGWDVDTLDWSRPGVDAIVQRILSVQPGQIVLMHDGGGERSQTVEALRIALPQLKEQGYKFVIVDELLAYGVAGE